ncbi:MAG: helix-turn-helix transcriptional regulator [Sphingopyxis sp.]|nr:helix-turn-helix transcriptional regulator [Sphingopyxis sp.]
MSARQSSSRLSDCLTEREIEILRLLVAGHTVKTIAARLGRSETSINERLRSARRKTGIGSSRELARLLDLQKNCDENIDLSGGRLAVAGRARTAAVGVRGPKGMFAMLIALSLAAAGLIVAGNPPADPVETTNAGSNAIAGSAPLAGSWLLDASPMPEDVRPQRVLMTFRPLPDGKWTTRIEIVGQDGSRRHSESSAAPDGVPVPVRGNLDIIDSVALRQPAPDTLVMTLGKGGARVSTRVYTVAHNGKLMTETIVWSSDRRQKLETVRFNRID